MYLQQVFKKIIFQFNFFQIQYIYLNYYIT